MADPKAKAKYLIDKYKTILNKAHWYSWFLNYFIAKECALAFVEELQKENELNWINPFISYKTTNTYKFWEDVKKEIKK